ncbi:MAG: hypothetical protein ABJD11_16010 [Gemmatimonadota bacterium]
MKASSRLGLGCLVLFCLPFCAVGIGTAIGAILAARQADWHKAGFLSIFALAFGGAGFGFIFAGFSSARTAADLESRQEQQPDAPWLWRADWAAGRVLDTNRGAMIGAWLFAGLWNLISFPAAYVAFVQMDREFGPHLLLVLIFPVAGLGLIAWAVVATIRFTKFGTSVLELVSVPTVIGREIAGRITTGAGLVPEHDIIVSLRCVNRITTGSGKSRSTTEHMLWKGDQAIPGAIRSAAGSTIPFVIAIPASCISTDTSDESSLIVWRLEATAAVPGVDYDASFEVPVFRTAESETAPPSVAAAKAVVPIVDASYVPPADSRIRVTQSGSVLDLDFPPARNVGPALGFSVFALIWTGVVIALIVNGEWFIGAIFGAFDVPLMLIILTLWFGRSSVHVEAGTITLRQTILGMGQAKNIPAKEVQEVTTSSGMQVNSKPYYDLQLTTADGKKVTLGSGVSDHREAEWLAGRIRALLLPV